MIAHRCYQATITASAPRQMTRPIRTMYATIWPDVRIIAIAPYRPSARPRERMPLTYELPASMATITDSVAVTPSHPAVRYLAPSSRPKHERCETDHHRIENDGGISRVSQQQDRGDSSSHFVLRRPAPRSMRRTR